MERCTEHDLLNCKCRESLATFLVKQFAESGRDVVDRSGTWSARPDAGRPDWRNPSDHRGRLGSINGGKG